MKICIHNWEYIGVIDKQLPYGEIESIAMFKCRNCKKEVNIYELEDNYVARVK